MHFFLSVISSVKLRWNETLNIHVFIPLNVFRGYNYTCWNYTILPLHPSIPLLPTPKGSSKPLNFTPSDHSPPKNKLNQNIFAAKLSILFWSITRLTWCPYFFLLMQSVPVLKGFFMLHIILRKMRIVTKCSSPFSGCCTLFL